ncbi:MAG: hypothetical protein AB4368_09785 [Xenococcaceae cyanobacterium]
MPKPIRVSLFLLLPITFMTGCWGFLDTIDSNTYQNYEETVAKGAIERGWIPDFLPVSAINIQEKHDLDTNEIILKFNFDLTDSEKLLQSCQSTNTFSPPTRLTAKWWSNDMINSADSHFYCNDGSYMAVNNNIVYYWRSSN